MKSNGRNAISRRMNRLATPTRNHGNISRNTRQPESRHNHHSDRNLVPLVDYQETDIDPYSQSWETSRNTRQPESRHKHHSDRNLVPLVDYQETYITFDELLSWNESSFSNHERPSARYCGRIHQVPVVMKEHNKQF